jgi:hypothetical protein
VSSTALQALQYVRTVRAKLMAQDAWCLHQAQDTPAAARCAWKQRGGGALGASMLGGPQAAMLERDTIHQTVAADLQCAMSEQRHSTGPTAMWVRGVPSISS